MAKFRYSLQNILNIKEKMETQAKQEFGMAQTALNVEIEHLERLKARKREYEEESGGLLQGKLDLMLSTTSRVLILGDWINYFSYAVFDGENLFLEDYIEGETQA